MISLLYVDDEPFLLDLAKNFLESTAGFSVDTKSSAREGLRALASRHYDAIVADYGMPEMDGIAFLRQVRRDYGNIPFILLNDPAQENVVISALNNRADFYLLKGNDPRILLTELGQVLDHCIRLRIPEKTFPDQEERNHDLRNTSDLIQSIGPDGRFLYVNKKWLDTLGYGEEDLADLRISDIVHPESRDQCRTTFQRIISGENAGIIDAVFKTRDGNKLYVEGVISCRMDDGKLLSSRGVFRDVTDRRLAETALRESEERFRALVETTRDIVWEVDRNGRFTYVSPQVRDILGYDPSELREKSSFILMPPDEAEILERAFNDAGSAGKPFVRLENRVLHKDGQQRILETSGEPVYAADGSLRGYRGIVRDITERKKAEEAICQSEQYLKSLLDSIPAGMIVIDAATHTIIRANPSALALFGAPVDEVVGKVCHQFICPAANGHCPVTDNGMQLDRSERILLTATGGQVPILKSVTRTNLDGHDVLIETFVDISDRKKAEEALRESEDRYRMLVENANEAIFVIQDGRICFANPKVEQIGRFTLEELSQKPFLEFVHPDDRGMVRDQHNRRLVGETLRNPYAFRIMPKEGSLLWMEISSSRITWNGQPAILVLLSDITEHKQAEEALRESEQKYRDIFEKSVSGLFKTLPNGRLIAANDALARMYGYPGATEMLKADINIVSNLYGRPQDRKAMVHMLAKDSRIENFEIEHLKRDGTRFWVSITARTIRKTDGTVIFYEGTIIDISERKRAEEAIRQANKKLTMLSSITRHDIRNKLMALHGYNQLAENFVTDETAREYLQKQGDAIDAIGQQIEFMKDYENIGVKAPVWQNVYEITNQAKALIDLEEISIRNDTENLEIYADSMLGKVFYNLIENSVRYGEAISEIHIRFGKKGHGSGLVIVFEDNGIGIPAGEKEKIFLKGFGRNTGLGLFLSREILSITGITIRETGKKPGGARFEIIVPNGAFRFIPSR